ncbi:MAG: V-type ATP synthase subunit D [Chitinivibrionales bacterium]|nr:V-type ATP synthase subunit D [Chitinivibrionales bacterium]
MNEHVSPTRMNLLATRSQIQRAKQGADLLSRKKDAMLREFLDIVGQAYRYRTELQDKLRSDVASLIVSEAMAGQPAVSAAAQATRQDLRLSVQRKNLWGAHTVSLAHQFAERDSFTRGYSPSSVNTAVDEIAQRFEKIGTTLLHLLPLQVNLQRIGAEIKKTNRKINSLEQRLLPQLEQRAAAITQALEERAREDTFRLKKMKKKRKKG